MDDLHEVALVACAAAAVLVHLSEKEAAEKEKENDENMRAALNNSVQKRQMLDETPVRGRKRPLPRDDDVADKDERGKSDGDANNERNEISTDPYDEDEDEENDAANAQTKSDKLKKATTSDSAKSFTLDNVLPEELRADYRILCKTGEGTFSTVYKAIDHRHEHYDNESWKHATNYSRFMVEKRPAGSGKFALKQFVAIKKIYVTSSPNRIMSEIQMLMELGGKHNVMPVIASHRCRDQVLVVMPYFEHHDFRIYMHAMQLEDIREYMRGLMEALAHVHAAGIIHRDIKPSNYLYDFKLRRGLLVDFGLAQRESEFYINSPIRTSTGGITSPHVKGKGTSVTQAPHFIDQSKVKQQRTGHASAIASGDGGFAGEKSLRKPGYFVGDARPPFRAARAGTRGFRAPEVLFRVPTQTCSIDVWSAGVVLLSLLSKQFPFFNSTDDQDAIVEIACIFGSRPMEKCAARYDRRWSTNLPGVPPAPVCSLDKLCFRYNVLLKETIALGAMGEHAPPEDVSSLTDDPNDTADTRERKKNARIVNKLAQEFFSATHHSHSTKESVDAMAESAPAALGPCLRRAAREYLDLFDLLKRLLALHHVDRITAAKCMEHPFLRKSTGQQ